MSAWVARRRAELSREADRGPWTRLLQSCQMTCGHGQPGAPVSLRGLAVCILHHRRRHQWRGKATIAIVMLDAESYHRGYAVVEQVIADLKAGPYPGGRSSQPVTRRRRPAPANTMLRDVSSARKALRSSMRSPGDARNTRSSLTSVATWNSLTAPVNLKTILPARSPAASTVSHRD